MAEFKSRLRAAENQGVRAAGSLLALVAVLAVGYGVYRAEVAPGPGFPGASAIVDQADVTGAENDLVSIAQAERLYLAGPDSYATLEQRYQEGSISFKSRHGYNFSIEADGARHFQATATPMGGGRAGRPTLSVDENVQVGRR